jgi:hypothetical protein
MAIITPVTFAGRVVAITIMVGGAAILGGVAASVFFAGHPPLLCEGGGGGGLIRRRIGEAGGSSNVGSETLGVLIEDALGCLGAGRGGLALQNPLEAAPMIGPTR